MYAEEKKVGKGKERKMRGDPQFTFLWLRHCSLSQTKLLLSIGYNSTPR